ncbi:MAG: hypothetical protein KGM42_16935 [Hyphomicrobiales bacterium]|nr:hypothetical protein [Hyphomicrobiales bacterium]
MTLGLAYSAQAQDALSGARLYADVARYASFGQHRFGSVGDRETTDWIAAELKAAGFATRFQDFALPRQYEVASAALKVGDKKLDALPFWWPPEDKASFHIEGRLTRDGDAAGKLLWITLPDDRGAYLDDAHRKAIAEAAARNPKAILLTIENAGDDLFAYNVTQEDRPWPVPVIVVAGRDRATLEAAMNKGESVAVDVDGRYQRNVAGRNVVATLGRGAKQTIVVSTPMTGWFSCVCERGPGVANFLAMARYAATRNWSVNFVFVATAGHEIGHGGMEVFLHDGAPKPDDTLAWVHFGAGNACYSWTKGADGFSTDKSVDSAGRALILSPSAQKLVREKFGDIGAARLVAEKTAVGELRDVKAAGYRNFLGMAGRHRFFHNPSDDLRTTGPEILEPVARAFAATLNDIAEKGEAAFR